MMLGADADATSSQSLRKSGHLPNQDMQSGGNENMKSQSLRKSGHLPNLAMEVKDAREFQIKSQSLRKSGHLPNQSQTAVAGIDLMSQSLRKSGHLPNADECDRGCFFGHVSIPS